jgi:hypothetical protein
MALESDSMRVVRHPRRTFSLVVAVAVWPAGVLPGCGSDRREPLPVEAKTPGQLKVPEFPVDKKSLAKNVNPKAARSIKDLQSKP